MQSHNQNDDDMDINGYIDGIRAAPKPIEEHLKEILHNSLEAIRLAEQKYPNEISSEIDINITIDSKNKPQQIVFGDKSTKGTGINELKEKGILQMYHHNGVKTGFSEYGEGGSESGKQMSNSILWETFPDSQVSETLSLNINKSTELNSFKKAALYSNQGTYKPNNGFTTGTQITFSDLTESYRSSTIGKMCLDGTMAITLSSYLIHINLNLQRPIHLNIIKGNEMIHSYPIVPKINLKGNIRVHELLIFKEKDTSDIVCAFMGIIGKNKSIQLLTFENKKKTVFNDTKYDNVSKCKLHLSTDEERDIKLMGFDGWRGVEGGNIVKTNSEPLKIQWDKWNSHRTRYAQFRGAIEYDRNSDSYVRSDKSKMITDDRPFEESIKEVMISLTDIYFKDMKKMYGHYNTEKKVKEEEDDYEPETEPEPEPEKVQVPVVTMLNFTSGRGGYELVISEKEEEVVVSDEEEEVVVVSDEEKEVVVNEVGVSDEEDSEDPEDPEDSKDSEDSKDPEDSDVEIEVVVNEVIARLVVSSVEESNEQSTLNIQGIIGTHFACESEHTTISPKNGLRMLEIINKNNNVQKEELYNKIIKEYQDNCAPVQSDKYLQFMTCEQKYQMIIYLINERYPSDTQISKILLCGAEIVVYYNKIE